MVVAGRPPLRCAITDLTGAGLGTSMARRMRLREQVSAWAADRIDLIQLREKTLDAGELLSLAELALAVLHDRTPPGRTRLLVNGRADVAAAAGAHGAHLTAAPGELTPAQVRAVFGAAGSPECVVGISCHSLADVEASQQGGADLLLFGPVFEKRVGGRLIGAGSGLERLRQACQAARGVPVLALGGVTVTNSAACLEAGAAGVAGIRLFG